MYLNTILRTISTNDSKLGINSINDGHICRGAVGTHSDSELPQGYPTLLSELATQHCHANKQQNGQYAGDNSVSA
jgi:hypothetical protein